MYVDQITPIRTQTNAGGKMFAAFSPSERTFIAVRSTA
eukprot:CAMPEP_0175287900 /NCGR_PEP_ID=MMETSP0093-20121207/54527_1 /TAXON_ID=311494 /ORGANISM="Alexandrium monilatum, Strain CCMP3105" /LENGTH=37 /DNA_ID= /DNA_START= /DNA_END= /DNA_ORIENTATION=